MVTPDANDPMAAYKVSLQIENSEYVRHVGYNNNPDGETPFVEVLFYAKTPFKIIRSFPSKCGHVLILRWRGNTFIAP